MNLYKAKMLLKRNRLVYFPFKKYKEHKEKKAFRKANDVFLRYGQRLAVDLENALSKTDLFYFFTYGNLLGLIRDGSFIKHDLDMDIGVLKNDRFDWEVLDNAMKTIDMHKKHEFIYDGNVVEATYENKEGLSVDFFLYHREDEHMFVYEFYRSDAVLYNSQYEFSAKMLIQPLIKNVQRREINGTVYTLPENPEIFLEEVYGEHWDIPDPNWQEFSTGDWRDCQMRGLQVRSDNQ